MALFFDKQQLVNQSVTVTTFHLLLYWATTGIEGVSVVHHFKTIHFKHYNVTKIIYHSRGAIWVHIKHYKLIVIKVLVIIVIML